MLPTRAPAVDTACGTSVATTLFVVLAMASALLTCPPKTGPRIKVYSGADHQARGGAVQWSRNDVDTRQPASSGSCWKRLKAARRSASSRVNTRFMPTKFGSGNSNCRKMGPESQITMNDRMKAPTNAHMQKSTSHLVRNRPPVADQNTMLPSECTQFFLFRELISGTPHLCPPN